MVYEVHTANTRDQIIGIQLTTTNAMGRPSLSAAISPCLSVSHLCACEYVKKEMLKNSIDNQPIRHDTLIFQCN